jgi:hypothetical protein
MKIINAKINSDLCACAIEEGLNSLKSKDISKVKLLTSTSYNIIFIHTILSRNKFKLNDHSDAVSFLYSNVDRTTVLEKDSWLLIDYSNNKIYFSGGI